MNEDDKYTYPLSGGVLVNSRGIRNAAELDELTNAFASVAMAELAGEPMPERPGFEYLKRIHERMFEPIIPGIAGRIRDVDVQATGAGIAYCRPDYIDESLTTLFGKLGREDYLVGLDERTFADRLADRWGELSAIHPWRDGNTRSQSFYVSRLADRAGHPIDWQRVDVDTLRELRLQAVVGREQPLADYLADRLLPGRGGKGVTLGHAVRRDGTISERANEAVQLASSDFPKSATAAAKHRPTTPARPGTSTRSPAQDRTNGMER